MEYDIGHGKYLINHMIISCNLDLDHVCVTSIHAINILHIQYVTD